MHSSGYVYILQNEYSYVSMYYEVACDWTIVTFWHVNWKTYTIPLPKTICAKMYALYFFTIRWFLPLLLESFQWLYFFAKFAGYMGHWMDMNSWKNQTDVIKGFDFIRKIEGSVKPLNRSVDNSIRYLVYIFIGSCDGKYIILSLSLCHE